MKLIYAQYSRKSSESKEKQAMSIDEQNDECKKAVERDNLTVSHIFQESKSAYKPNNRPEFTKMIELIEAGKINAILTWKPDRLCRNPREGGILLQLLQDGILREIRSTDGEIYTQDSDHLILQIHFGMANQYSRNLSKNVKRGNHYIFHNLKKWIGPAKPGYFNYYDESTKEKKIGVDEERFPLLQNAMKLIISGTYTPMEALDVLNNKWKFRSRARGSKGGLPMAKSGWYRILTDSYYYGLMVRSEGSVVGTHVPMLTEDEFDTLQMRLGRKGKPRMAKHEFAYKSVLKCGECDGSVTAEEKVQIICSSCKQKFHKGKLTNACSKCGLLIEEMKNPKILHYVFYHCTKRVNKTCSQGSVTLKNLEDKINNELDKFEISDEFRDWCIDHLNELNDKEEVDIRSIKDSLVKQMENCDKALAKLTRLRISRENISNSAEMEKFYDDEEARLLKERKDTMKQIETVDKKQEDWYFQSKETFNFACSAKYQFETGDVRTKTYILSKLGSNLTILDRSLQISGERPYFLIEKAKREIEDIVNALEPKDLAVISSNLIDYQPISSVLLGDMDSNHDKRLQRPLSYH